MAGIKRIVLLLCLLILGSTAKAACTAATNGSATFGSITSFGINGAAQNTSTALTLSCDTVLNLLTSDFVTLTYLSASPLSGTRAGMQRSGTAEDTVPVMLCIASGCGSEITTGGSATWSDSTLLNLLGNKTYSLPVYFRTIPGASIAAGNYQTTLTLRLNWSICSLGVAACLLAQTGSATLTVNVMLVVTSDCSTITAPAVNFNSAALVVNFPVVSQTISLTCTKGSTYTVGINNGNYASGSVRNMASGNNRLSYELYKGTTSNRWGVSGTERWASASATSVSTDGLLRMFSYTAKVLSGQSTPAVGSYSDTLVVDVAF